MRHIRENKVFEVLKQSILVDGMDMVFDPEKSRGARIYDSKNGRSLIDFFSFFASQPIGFNHPRMSEKDFENELLKAAKTKVTNSDIYTTAYAEFVDTFKQKAAPTFDRLFFIEGGALAVENAVKAAQDWKVQKNEKAGITGEVGTQVLHFKEAFHGRTGYTLSLTNTLPDKIRNFAKFDWPRVSNPKLNFPLTEDSVKNTITAEKNSEREIKEAFASRPNEICCILIEPIQAEGGDNHFRPEFLKKLRQLADENEALLIFDEVQTGMGLTGRFWAFEHFGVVPDMIAFGKKAQVCGVAANMTKLKQVENVFDVSSRINSTWGGNIVDMVRCTQYLDIISEENMVQNAASMGETIVGELTKLSQKYPAMTNVRGKGLMIAFDMPSAEERGTLLKKTWDEGVMILPCGNRSIRLRPALNLKADEAEEGLSLIEKALSKS